MTIDKYTRAVLTVIALALVYLCVVLTPVPAVSAQTALRPGDPTGPGEVVIVGWRTPRGERIPVHVMETAPTAIVGEVRVTGTVQTQQRPGTPDRVVLVGWEERANVGKLGTYRMLEDPEPGKRVPALPVTAIAPRP